MSIPEHRPDGTQRWEGLSWAVRASSAAAGEAVMSK